MAAKFLILSLAVIALHVSAEDCDCKNPGDTKELWDFFNKLSPDKDNLNDEEKDMYSVLPGLLSPLFECNCLEKNIKKREVTPEVVADVKSSSSAESKQEIVRAMRQRKSIRFGTRRCPAGFAKVGYLCVKEEFLD